MTAARPSSQGSITPVRLSPEVAGITPPSASVPGGGPPPAPGGYTGEPLRRRYAEVHQRIAAAARRSGRDPSSVVLVAVTKYAGVDQVRELIMLGHRDFGENQVQQLLQRASAVDEWLARQRGVGASRAGSAAAGAGAPVRWHMIGHLQRNKARKAAELCRLVQSMESLRLAEELQAAGLRLDRTIDVLIQVNTSGEPSRFGCAPAAASRLAEEVMTMANVRIRGLMTMASEGGADASRRTFARTYELFEELSRTGVAGPPSVFNILSMGMSGDYEAAIEEGANLVRVGSAIVGAPRLGPGDGPGPAPGDRAA